MNVCFFNSKSVTNIRTPIFFIDVVTSDNTLYSNRYFCEHCGERISKTLYLYYQHKKMFYSPSSQIWTSDPGTSSMSQISVSDPQSYSKDFTFINPDDDDSFETGIYVSLFCK